MHTVTLLKPKVRQLLLAAKIPEELEAAIIQAYRKLCSDRVGGCDVAVRSSATAEDLPDACRRCFASLFTDRAISYRSDKGFDHFRIALSIGIQNMVRFDLASAGAIYLVLFLQVPPLILFFVLMLYLHAQLDLLKYSVTGQPLGHKEWFFVSEQ